VSGDVPDLRGRGARFCDWLTDALWPVVVVTAIAVLYIVREWMIWTR
jgi:hypothetical protein